MAHTLLINPTIISMLDGDLEGQQMLAVWMLIEETYPNGTGRPAYYGRVAGAKKTGLKKRLSGSQITIKVDHDTSIVSLEGDPTKPDTFMSLNEFVRSLVMQGISVELPELSEEEAAKIKVVNEKKRLPEHDEGFVKILPLIKDQTLVMSLIDSFDKKEEKLFIERRVTKYYNEFPELKIAPDEALMASLIVSEIVLYRLQREVAKGKAVNPKQMEQAQANWSHAANALGITRAQRLKQGDGQGTSIADLSAQYDELQRRALRQFEQDIKEEQPIIETAEQRKMRELAPGTAESVLSKEFGITADRARGEFVIEEETDDV